MDELEIAGYADELRAAYGTRQTVDPLIARSPGAGVDEAYAIQLAQVNAWTAAGRRIAGFKVGLTSLAMQKQLGVDRPDFGHLFGDMILDGSAIDTSAFIAPRLEPEISFVLKEDLTGPGLSIIEVIHAVDYAIASVELIDSRVRDWKITLPDTIADNASSGALVLGTRPLRIDAADLGTLGCVLTRNGEIVATGAGAAVLGHPLTAVLFLANTLGALGRPLPAGSVVMAGALTAAVPVTAGDRFSVEFSQLGTVTANFLEHA